MRRELTGVLLAAVTAGPVLAGLAPAHAAVTLATAVTSVPCRVPSLISAVKRAASGDTLSLAPSCRYLLTAGLPVIRKSLTLDGNNATLERSTNPFVKRFTILRAAGSALTINDLNFRNGDNAITITGPFTALTVNGGTFTGNSGTNGGAISQTTGGNGPIVTGAQFIANTASGSGGAIYDNAALAGAVLTDCTFLRNTAAAGGGGIYDFSAGNDSATRSRFVANRAADGGGGVFSTDATYLTDVVASGNVASGNGGAFSVVAVFTVEDSVIENNRSGANGGGLDAEDALFAKVIDTTVRGNSAADGGGIYNNAFNGLSLTGDKILSNVASGYGGGLFNAGSGPPSESGTATDTTIAGNMAGAGGGGIYDQGNTTFSLTTSVVQGNQPDNCEPLGSVPGCLG